MIYPDVYSSSLQHSKTRSDKTARFDELSVDHLLKKSFHCLLSMLTISTVSMICVVYGLASGTHMGGGINIAGVLIFFLGYCCPSWLSSFFSLVNWKCHKSGATYLRLYADCCGPICATLGLGMVLLSSSLDDRCGAGYKIWKRIQCSNSASLTRLSPDLLILVAFSPAIFSILSGSHRPFYASISWMISFVAIVTSISLSHSLNFLPYPIYSMLMGRLLYEVFRRNEYLLKTCKRHFENISTSNHDSLNLKLVAQGNILKQLVGNIIHDLLTPMQALEIGLETLQMLKEDADSTVVDGDSFELFQSMKGTMSLMSSIVHRCMDVFHASDGSVLVAHYEIFDFPAVVSRVGRYMGDMQNRIRLDVRFLRGLRSTQVHTDKRWFQDNILCLVSNAVKFSRDIEGVKVELKVFTTNSLDVNNNLRKMLTVEVWDSGMNMADEVRTSLFDMPSTHGRLRTGGAGWGLYIMAKRVAALGGVVGSRDRNDRLCDGSVFWFSVPCDSRILEYGDQVDALEGVSTKSFVSHLSHCSSASNLSLLDVDSNSAESAVVDDDGDISGSTSDVCEVSYGLNGEKDDTTQHRLKEEEDSDTEAPPLTNVYVKSHKQSLSILVVDNSTTVMKLFSMSLKQQGHTFEKAVNGLDALQKMAQQEYDVVLMDMIMPVMSGCESVRLFREYENACRSRKTVSIDQLLQSTECLTVRTRRQLIICMSANYDAHSKKEAIMSGMDGFLCKPFSREDLLEIVAEKLQPVYDNNFQGPPNNNCKRQEFLCSLSFPAPSLKSNCVQSPTSASFTEPSQAGIGGQTVIAGSKGHASAAVSTLHPSVAHRAGWPATATKEPNTSQFIRDAEAEAETAGAGVAFVASVDSTFSRSNHSAEGSPHAQVEASMQLAPCAPQQLPEEGVNSQRHFLGRSLRILVIERPSPMLEGAVIGLQDEGHAVDQVGHIVEGFQLLSQQHYHIAVVDMDAPDTSACDVVQIFRAQETALIATGLRSQRQFIVGVSARTSPESNQLILSSGLSAIVSKPWNARALLDCWSRDSVDTFQPQLPVHVTHDSANQLNLLVGSCCPSESDAGDKFDDTEFFEKREKAELSGMKLSVGSRIELGEKKFIIDSAASIVSAPRYDKSGKSKSISSFSVTETVSQQHSTRSRSLSISSNTTNDGSVDTTTGGMVLSILIVEDSIPISKALSMNLKKSGHSVAQVVNGALGLQAMQEKAYDIVLMDLQMPEMGGCEATKRFREFEASEDCKDRHSRQVIIGMSANAGWDTESEAIGSGMDGFIAKPFKVDLMMKIAREKLTASLLKASTVCP